jgi:hypothetical protein
MLQLPVPIHYIPTVLSTMLTTDMCCATFLPLWKSLRQSNTEWIEQFCLALLQTTTQKKLCFSIPGVWRIDLDAGFTVCVEYRLWQLFPFHEIYLDFIPKIKMLLHASLSDIVYRSEVQSFLKHIKWLCENSKYTIRPVTHMQMVVVLSRMPYSWYAKAQLFLSCCL